MSEIRPVDAEVAQVVPSDSQMTPKARSPTFSDQPMTRNTKLLDFWILINSEEVLTWESLFINIAVLLEVDLEALDTIKLRKRLDPAATSRSPTLAKLVLAVKDSPPEQYFTKFITPSALVSPSIPTFNNDQRLFRLVGWKNYVDKSKVLTEDPISMKNGEPPLPSKFPVENSKIPIENAKIQEVKNIDNQANPSPRATITLPRSPSKSKLKSMSTPKHKSAIENSTSLDQIKSDAENTIPIKPSVKKTDQISKLTAQSVPSVPPQYLPEIPKTDSHTFRQECAKANQNDPVSQYFLASCFHIGHHIPKDDNQALYWFRKSAESFYPPAEFTMGVYYEYGLGGKIEKRDLQTALSWYKRAADHGSVKAMCHLGNYYCNAAPGTKSFKKSFQYYEKAAALGNAEALNILALFYENGVATKKTLKKAAEMHKKSAELGCDGGMVHYAKCLMEGIGVKKSEDQGIMWYIKAANLGNADAQNTLGVCYLKGTGVDQDTALAFEIFSSASQQEYPPALHNLAHCYEFGEGTTPDYSKAIGYYQMAAEKGHAESQYHLGNIYENGLGTAIDYPLAKYWKQKARDQGYMKSSGFCIIL